MATVASLLWSGLASAAPAPATPHPVHALPNAAADAAADEAFKTPEYRDCLAKTRTKPDDAFEDALAWRDQGGGVPAEHCAAMALMALNQPENAAPRFDALARSPDAGTLAARATFLDQAGNAWLLARDPVNAEGAFSEALRMTPRDADVWTDRARARAMQRNWPGAETDLSFALVFAKKSEIYVLRAAARKALNRMKDARADIDTALKLDPKNADALVERGSFRLIAGDKAGARADWLQVLLIAPDGPAGDEARRRIEDLEIHPGR